MIKPDDVIYKNRYIWNQYKNEMNQQKHHLSFETASLAFETPDKFGDCHRSAAYICRRVGRSDPEKYAGESASGASLPLTSKQSPRITRINAD